MTAGHASRDDGGHADGPGPGHGLEVEAQAGHQDGAGRADVDARGRQLRVGRVHGDDDAADGWSAPADLGVHGQAVGADVDPPGQHGLDDAADAGAWMMISPLPAARRVRPSRPCSQTRVR